jgi:FkbM family methyltransferase
MNTASRIRHSFVGKAVRMAIHLMFRIRHPSPSPVAYELPGGVQIRLYPEGEIAEFLAFPWLFENAEVALAGAFLKSGMTVIDVGANIGLYSILAAKRVGPSGSVWAFEPSNVSAARLERNLTLNDCKEVRVCQLALSDTPNSSLSLVSDPGFGDAYRYLRTPKDSTGEGNSEMVPVTTLDAWAAANGVVRSDFIKVDIEGGEYKMFMGARDFLMSNPNVVIMFECEADWCARAGCSPRDVFDLLRSFGFNLYSWDHQSRRWNNDSRFLARSGMFWAARSRSALPDPWGP